MNYSVSERRYRYWHIVLHPKVMPVSMALVVTAVLLLFGSFTRVEVADSVYWHVPDDHMITQRVALNTWLKGMPYYNPDEAVAANTSLFWPIVISPLYAVFPVEKAIPAVILISAVIWAVAVVVATRILLDPVLRWSTVLALALLPSAVFYGPSAWEHVPQTLAVTLAFGSILVSSNAARRLSIPAVAPIFLAVAFLARTDIAATICVVLCAYLITDHRWRRPATYAFLAALATVPTAYIALMLHFYGDVVPNTAHLKVLDFDDRFTNGLLYLTDPYASGPVPVLLLILTILSVFKRPRPGVALFLAAAWMHLLLVTYLGGDYFSAGRFFLVYLPLALALLVDMLSRWGARPSFLAVTLAVVVPAWYIPQGPATHGNHVLDFGVSENHPGLLRAMHAVRGAIEPEDGSIGLHHLGMGYHVPEFHIVDFLGKAEPVIARSEPRAGPTGHNKWDYDYAFTRYDIAVVPVRAFIWDAAQASHEAERAEWKSFWLLSAYAMVERGYVFISPETLGNGPRGWGLAVRRDLGTHF